MTENSPRRAFADRRRRGIGGSDVAAILGVSKFGTAWNVLASKRGLKKRDDEREQDHLLLGRLMEPVVAALYEHKEGRKLVTPPGFIEHPEHPCIIANPDRFVEYEERGVEIKTCGLWGRGDWGEEGTDEVPADYLMQSAHYMAVTGWDVWDVPVLFHGSRYARYVVQRDLDLERWMLDRLTSWWQRHVVEGWDLPLDDTHACAEFIGMSYPENRRNEMPEASADSLEAAQRLIELRSRMDVIETEATGLENILKDEIGETDGLVGAFGKVTWKRSKDSMTTDWQAVAAQLLKNLPKDKAAQIVAANQKTRAGSRRFVLTPPKEGKQ